jgi:peptidoglycan/LPS O-acetylase OafA/YrhL
MSESMVDPPRVAWLDGLRGIAAIQVVLMHYASAFLPGIGLRDPHAVHFTWENAFIYTPLFLPFDGYSAVYIFFVLSGVALTYSFGLRPYAIAAGIGRRIVRLGIPMTGAVLVGAIWFSLWPRTHVAASAISGSGWLAALGPDQTTFAAIIHQIGLEGMLVGYSEVSVLPWMFQKPLNLTSLFKSFDAPLWTLHIEFIGSLLVLGLVALRQAVTPRTHLGLCALLIGALSSSTLFLFVVGHLATEWLRTPADRRYDPWFGISLCALGILLCTTETFAFLPQLIKLLPTPFLGRTETSSSFQSMYGAVAIFFGIASLPHLQQALQRPSCRWLGKISFSLYLSHFSFLIAGGSAALVLLATRIDYPAAVFAVSVIGIAFSLLVAAGFEVIVDRPAILLSRRIARRLVHRQ